MKKENNLLKMLKKLLLISKLIFITFFLSSFSYADLIKPNNGIEPYQVVKIQLRSLKKNDKPSKDNGIEQTWEFAHPNNKKNTGPLSKFKIMLKGASYEMLLNHLEHEVFEVQLTDNIASYEVTILDKSKKYYKFKWIVEKHIKEGPLKDCWLTVMVSAPQPLGSSV
tara:strand:- start:359 stop:859 length:501 start_codon:yes stop_codon:yes gene_type:complete